MEARDIDGKELLMRVQQCEEKLSEFTESKLSPFNQQEILGRLGMLEEHQKAQDEALALAAKEALDRAADPPAGSGEVQPHLMSIRPSIRLLPVMITM